ncbi:MAG: helix-turn-helix domain-containing protein [Actinomycetota bacterium]
MLSAELQDVDTGHCPVVATARIVSGKWTLLILRDLAGGPRRFTELERSLAGISPRTLSARLRSLEEEGILERREYCQVPPRVEYALTRRGMDLLPIVDAMRDYGTRWLVPGEAQAGPEARTAAL